MNKDIFDSLSSQKGLQVLKARTAEELLAQIQKITLPTHIVQIYANGGTHYAWIQTQAKIVKTKKKELNNG